MSAEQLANRFETTLVGAIDGVVGTLTLASVVGAPATAQWRLVLDGEDPAKLEYVLVTARVGAVCTVTRGIEGTAGVAHAAGASAVQVLTVGGLDQYVADRVGSLPPAAHSHPHASRSEEH